MTSGCSAIAPADPGEETAVGGDSWSATLALTREQALELIEAENFAREIRLIPASMSAASPDHVGRSPRSCATS